MIASIRNYFAARRATRDIVRLFEYEMSAGDQQRMAASCSDDADYQDSFVSTLRAIADMDELANDPDIIGVVQEGERAGQLVHNDSNSQLSWPRWAMAATILAAVIASVYVPYQSGSEDGVALRHVTRIGEQKTVDLPDGSTIILNTGTRVLVEQSSDIRRVILERGEVYFDVAKDAQRPFTVELGSRSVSVLGTQFNLYKSPDKFVLAVVEGAVSIHHHEEPLSAQAPLLSVPDGERVEYRDAAQRRVEAGTVVEYHVSQQKLAAFQPENIGRYQSWRTGLIHFDREPLYKVVQELNRYSGKKILIEDASIMNMEVYAGIKVDRLDMAMVLLEESLPVKVIKYFDRTVIVREDDETNTDAP